MKSLLQSRLVITLLGGLIWLWMVSVARTVRWQIYGEATAQKAWSQNDGLIFAAWHEQIMLLPSGWSRVLRNLPARKGGVSMLVSLSRDAAPVAKALDYLGITTIRGSKSNAKKRDKDKGGVRAIAEAMRLLKNGGVLCITPDGPRGPAKEVSGGPALIALRSNARIVPYALATSNHRRTRSWDRMILPLPFGKGAIIFGDPISADGKSPEQLQAELGDALALANQRAIALSSGRSAIPQ